MRVLHLDVERGRRGGQVQLEHLLANAPTPVEHCTSAARFPVQVARFRPDVIAAHSARSHQLALIAPIPLVVHRRVDFPIRRRARWKYGLARGIVAVSHAVRDMLVEGGVRAPIDVVHDAVRPRTGSSLPRTARPIVLVVGALVDHKDHATLIEASRGGGFEVWIAGTGPLAGSLRRQASGLPVRFLGQRDDVPDLLATADVFCHPSREEGLGQALLEARAAGVRIVATRAGGIPEAVGASAWLVPPGDPIALRAAVEGALEAPRPEPELPPTFTVAEMVQRTWSSYARALG